MLGKCAGFRQEVPAFKLRCNREEVASGFSVTVDICGLECFDSIRGALLAGAKLREADHPGGIVVREQVEPLVVGGGEFRLRRIGLAKASFDVGSCGIQVNAVFANVDSERVCGFDCRKVIESGFSPGKQDHEAGIA